jgi:transposase-like protein
MICPRCKRNVLQREQAFNALSRKDNQTYVCSPCGEDEAVLDWLGQARDFCHSIPWPVTHRLRSFMDLVSE